MPKKIGIRGIAFRDVDSIFKSDTPKETSDEEAEDLDILRETVGTTLLHLALNQRQPTKDDVEKAFWMAEQLRQMGVPPDAKTFSYGVTVKDTIRYSYTSPEGERHTLNYDSRTGVLQMTRNLAESNEDLKLLEDAVNGGGIEELVIGVPPLGQLMRVGKVTRIEYID